MGVLILLATAGAFFGWGIIIHSIALAEPYAIAQGNARKGLLYGVNEACHFANLLIILDYFLEVV